MNFPKGKLLRSLCTAGDLLQDKMRRCLIGLLPPAEEHLPGDNDKLRRLAKEKEAEERENGSN